MSQTWIIFDTQSAADIAQTQISNNMNLPTSDGSTDRWSVPVQRLDGKWCFVQPEAQYLVGVSGYTIEPFNHTWFPSEFD